MGEREAVVRNKTARWDREADRTVLGKDNPLGFQSSFGAVRMLEVDERR